MGIKCRGAQLALIIYNKVENKNNRDWNGLILFWVPETKGKIDKEWDRGNMCIDILITYICMYIYIRLPLVLYNINISLVMVTCNSGGAGISSASLQKRPLYMEHPQYANLHLATKITDIKPLHQASAWFVLTSILYMRHTNIKILHQTSTWAILTSIFYIKHTYIKSIHQT